MDFLFVDFRSNSSFALLGYFVEIVALQVCPMTENSVSRNPVVKLVGLAAKLICPGVDYPRAVIP